MLKMLWLASLLILVSIGGCFCDDDDDDDYDFDDPEYKCFRGKRDECEKYRPFEEFPQTAEELLTACRDLERLGRCVAEASESCNGGPNILSNHVREIIAYMEATCQEDTPTFIAITNNLPCVERVIKSRENFRCITIFSEQNREQIHAQADLLTGGYIRDDLGSCLYDLMNVACEGISFGYHCGEEVKKAVEEIEAQFNSPHFFLCTPEHLEELSPFMRMFERLLIEELELQNALKRKRK